MKPIISILARSLILLMALAGVALASTPLPNISDVRIEQRIFDDCPFSTLTVIENYPNSIEITDAMLPGCLGFANLHGWSFTADGGATALSFPNNSNFHFGADLMISGAGEGEGGLRISPWWSPFVDGRFMANVTSGEIACFGGRLPFYSFTAQDGIIYTRGTTIRMEMTYLANGLSSTSPGTIQYRVIYDSVTYESPVLPFDSGNPAEDPPHGLWGILNEARAGGYFQPRANTGESLTATWSNVDYGPLDPQPVPTSAAIETRIFDDCPFSTLTIENHYPLSVSIEDVMLPGCLGFANLHSWSLSTDGGATAARFDNESTFNFGSDFKLAGAGEGEGGLRISPWWSPFVDGRFMVNATTGEIACFGGRLPFYSFTAQHAITYARGSTIRLEVILRANGLSAADPATIRYRVIYNSSTYDSPVLAFDSGNPAEDPPYGLWGILNGAFVGGYFQPRANTGADMTATWSNIAFSHCPVQGSVLVFPKFLNLSSSQQWMTAYIWLPRPYLLSAIDLASLRLNGVPAALDPPPQIRSFGHGSQLVAKFDRNAVKQTLASGLQQVTVSGEVGSTCFEAKDWIWVRTLLMSHPLAGDVIVPGSSVDLAWEVPNPMEAPTVSLIASFDDGRTWSMQAENIANDGSCHWAAPNVASSRVHVALVTVREKDETGYVTGNEVAEVGPLTLAATTGVEQGQVGLALRNVTPNPARDRFDIVFSLPSSAPAMLTVFDVAGRRVFSREVGGLGAGEHTVRLGALPSGLYLVRLNHAGKNLTSRVVVLK